MTRTKDGRTAPTVRFTYRPTCNLRILRSCCFEATAKMSSGWLHRGVALIFLGILTASIAPVAGEAQGAVELEKLEAQTLQLLQSGQYAEATEIAKRSLALAEKLHGRDHPEVATALINLGMLLGITNRLAEAEPLYRRALAIDEKNLGPEHPNVARDLNNLAGLLQATNRLAEAEPLYRRALAIDEKSLGPEHPNVARDLNNLALLLQATNRLAEAEPLYRRALAIDEKNLGSRASRRCQRPQQPGPAASGHQPARPRPSRSIAVRWPSTRRASDPTIPTWPADLNNLAGLLQATNRLAEAEPLYRRALAIDEKSFGPEHPNVATALNNLAELLQDTNRLAEAEPLYRRALAIDEKSLGPEHPTVATAPQQPGRSCFRTPTGWPRPSRFDAPRACHRREELRSRASQRGQRPQQPGRAASGSPTGLAEAEPLYRRALAIDEKSFGPEHPGVARDLNNLACCFRPPTGSAEAEPLYRRALAIDEKSFGPEHPDVARDLNNLALLLQATNRLAEAEPLIRRALAIDEKSFGPEHPDVAICLNNLACCFRPPTGWRRPSRSIAVRLAIDEKSFGPEHPRRG